MEVKEHVEMARKNLPDTKRYAEYVALAEMWGNQWAQGYIDNYDVSHVYEKIQEWVYENIENGSLKTGVIREAGFKGEMFLELIICPSDCDKIYFFKTEWYAGRRGEISHGVGSRYFPINSK